MRFILMAPLVFAVAACAAPEQTQVASASTDDGDGRRELANKMHSLTSGGLPKPANQ